MYIYMDIYKTRIGDKVRYLNKSGYDGDREQANKYLKEGEEYEVCRPIRIGRSSSEVYLKGINSVSFLAKKDFLVPFNTVMFENVEDVSNRREESGDWEETYGYVKDGEFVLKSHKYNLEEEHIYEQEKQNNLYHNTIAPMLEAKEEVTTFKLGKCYRHTTGHEIKVIGVVDSTLYGMGLMAETNKHSERFQRVGNTEDHSVNYIEISEEEWMKNFSKE